jgi:ubiquinone biosynthesis protein
MRLTSGTAIFLVSIPAVFLIAWVASRLLGTRHSWVTTIVSGVTGWTSGVVFSLIMHGGNLGLLRQAVLEIATLRRRFDDEQLERALSRFIGRHLGPGSVPNAAMLNDTMQLFYSFGITLPAEFGSLFRALITLEGTLTVLCPGYYVIDEAQKLATQWAGEQVTAGSVRELATKELIGMAPILRRVPRHVDRIASLIERGNLAGRISLFSDPEDLRVLTRLVNRFLLAFIGTVGGIISVILIGTQGGPHFTGDTSLFQFFGYFGFF